MGDLLLAVVRAMDSGYLEWMRSEHDRHARANKPQAPSQQAPSQQARRGRRRGK